MTIPGAPRSYRSPGRKAQADETRQKITAAARAIFLERGYDAATIGAVAERAGVAEQTVYAGFGSKRGLVAALLEAARFGASYERLVQQSHEAPDPATRLRLAASIACEIYGAEREEMELLRGVRAVSPEFAFAEGQEELARREAQAGLVAHLAASGRLRPALDIEAARDVLWALTARDLYRAFVVVRGWPRAQFEAWLAATLVETLLAPPA